MLNKYPLWKNLLVLFVTIFGFIYAVPNIYPDDPALQITASKAGVEIQQAVLDDATGALKKAGINIKKASLADKTALIRFHNVDDQLNAQEIVKKALAEQYGDKYIVALNLAATTPQWLRDLGAGPMKLGLDLRGGVHFLMEVDMDRALDTRIGNDINSIRDRFREQDIRAKTLRPIQGNGKHAIDMVFKDSEVAQKAKDLLRREFPNFQIEETDNGGEVEFNLTYTPQALKEIQDYAVDQNLTSIRNRVNELGVTEPVVTRQGPNRIVIELPGIQDTAEAKRTIGKAANLEFHLVDTDHSSAEPGHAPPGTEWVKMHKSQREVLLDKQSIVTGENVIDAKPNYDQYGKPMVSVTLDSAGGRRMMQTTTKHVKDSMAVLFIESKPETRTVMIDGKPVQKTFTKDHKEAISVATIQGVFGSQFQITGLDSYDEAKELALLMRAGALAAPMYFVEERTIGPSMGKENIASGIKSLVLGFALVMLFMVIYYKMFGMIANLGLFMNLLFLVACMSLIPGATLSLPGMAGIVLTVGMAVDSNVLIFERMKEELRNGLSPQAAINAGYDRAFVTIFDSNITTLLVGLVLFALGSGPVKGFAVTLSLGIITSMFTSIVGTRAVVNLLYGGRTLKTLRI